MKEVSAGGLVYKKEEEKLQILIIEDRFQKISIPKGKQELGETLEETAIREIDEETGIKGVIKGRIERVHYQYNDQTRGVVDKEVTYYVVEAVSGQLETQIEEINKVYWVEQEEASQLQKERGYANNDFIFEKGLEMIHNIK